MSEHYKAKDPDQLYFITSTIVSWIDLFTREEYIKIILDSWQHCITEKGLRVHAFCVMPSHVHAIMSSGEKPELWEITRDWKAWTARHIIQAIKNNGKESRKDWLLRNFDTHVYENGFVKNAQLWRQGYHPICLNTAEKLEQRLNYIHYNPVKAGYVMDSQQWLYSSARYYEGVDCDFPLDLVVV